VSEISRFDHEREGDDAIRALMLRPGASQTAVLRIELTGNRRISADDIQIVRQGQSASVRLHVPGIKHASQPAAAEPAPQPLQPIAAPSAPQPAAAEPPPLAAAAKPATIGAKPSLPKPDLGFADSRDTTSASPPWLAFGISTLVLGGCLATLSYFNKKKNHGKPVIEVIGSRRLGHRQELLIVRALGGDHLLLCTGGRAERVASMPSPLAPLAEDVPQLPEDSSQADGIISRFSSQSRLRKLLDSVDHERAVEERASARPAAAAGFGAALYSASRRESKGPSLRPVPSLRQSDAVAGIARLRRG
jgi:hypothetical protein